MPQAQPHYLEVELQKLLETDPSILKFLQAGSLDGLWYWDLENPEHEYMSPEFWKLFGYDPATKQHLVSEWQDLIFPEDLAVATENLNKHIADASHPYDQVVRYRCAGGDTAWVRCRGLAVRDDTGKAIRLLGAHNDITELKRQQIASAALLTELEAIFNATTSGIIALNDQGVVVRINQQARHMLGGITDDAPFAWPEQIRFLDVETLHPLDASADPMRRALAGTMVQRETHLLRRVQSGEDRRYVRVSCAFVPDESGMTRVVLVLDDVSLEERNRQVVERKSRLDALGQLTGGIAHDFNNLLASQLYAVDLFSTADDLEKRDRYIAAIKLSIERGRALTSRLLAFARRQPGLASAKRSADVLSDFQGLVDPMIEASIDLKFGEVENDLWHFCDQSQLETALMNLVLNSRDAILRSGKGDRIEVSARAVRSTDDDLDERQTSQDGGATPDGSSYRYVEFSVADNGPGMDDETLARCTDPFFTTKDANSGTGLGLAIVYGFIRQAEGDLRIYSEEGIGTTVRLTLPRGTDTGTREKPVPDDVLRGGSGELILLVEDEVLLMTIMVDALENLGYEVVTAISGREALQILEGGERPALILTDIVMPGTVNGFELARQARKLLPNIPVLYMSGYTGFTIREMGEVQAPLIQKPAPPADLAEAIATALGAAGRT